MKYHFFTIHAKAPDAEQEALNAFCRQYRVLAVDKQFVALGDNSFWSICVTAIDGEEKPNHAANKRTAIDYREVLNEQDFAVYAELRNLRKTLAIRWYLRICPLNVCSMAKTNCPLIR
jgi:hypothetical protein